MKSEPNYISFNSRKLFSLGISANNYWVFPKFFWVIFNISSMFFDDSHSVMHVELDTERGRCQKINNQVQKSED